jgi:hypothetical protein
MPTKNPRELQPGDVFRAAGGPYGGHWCKVVAIEPGRYSTYKLRVKIVNTVEVSVDYSQDVEVRERA